MGFTPSSFFTAFYALYALYAISGVYGAYKYADITYSSVSADKFRILNTEDSSLCAKHNAVTSYSGYSYNSVTCKCTSTNQLFYAASSNQVPKCSYENDGRLFGKCKMLLIYFFVLMVSDINPIPNRLFMVVIFTGDLKSEPSQILTWNLAHIFFVIWSFQL